MEIPNLQQEKVESVDTVDRINIRLAPHLDFAIVRPADDPLAVEADAPDELLVALQHAEAGPALDVPQPDGVVRAAAHHESGEEIRLYYNRTIQYLVILPVVVL